MYDGNDRLLQTTQEQFTYDNNGSLKSRSHGTSTTNYDWINDGENRLVGVTSTKPGSTSNIITEPVTLYEHIRRYVPRGNRPPRQYYPNFVTQIDVPENTLLPDPGGKPDVTAWLSPNIDGATITNVWSVTEPVIGKPAVLTLLPR